MRLAHLNGEYKAKTVDGAVSEFCSRFQLANHRKTRTILAKQPKLQSTSLSTANCVAEVRVMAEHQSASHKTEKPSVWERITAVTSLAIAVGGLGALVFAWFQIREMRDEARVQHLIALVDKFDSADQVAIRRSLALKRVDQTQKRLRPLDVSDAPIEFYDELGFCEDLGLLTRRGYLDPHDVWNEFSDWLFYLYADARPLLDAEQKHDPAEYRECTNLVESTRPIERQEAGGADDHPTEEELYNGYLGDIEQPGQFAGQVRGSKKGGAVP
jgi:hypothetical protein